MSRPFRFERLMALRSEQHGAALLVLQIAVADRDRAVDEIAGSSRRLAQISALLAAGDCLGGGMAALLADESRGVELLRIKDADKLAAAESAIVLARESLRVAWKKLRKLEILRDKHREKVRHEEAAEEGKLLDEVGLRRSC